MIKNLTLVFLLLFLGGAYCQGQSNDSSPVKLKGKVKHIGDNQYQLVVDFDIDEDWCVYSQDLPEGGPIPTSISFEKSTDFILDGSAKEESQYVKEEDDEVFNMHLTKYYRNVLFKQVIKLKNKGKKRIKADVNFMSCTTDFCLPPSKRTVVFEIE